jgi:hypothetical protein
MNTSRIRNNQVSQILTSAISSIKNRTDTGCQFILHEDIEQIVDSKTLSFRELLLVILIARSLDPNYCATSDLYACSPRAIYEGPIRAFLQGQRIPCGQSGPLNIAKAIKAIDGSWAATRRPRANAEQLLKVVERIESGSSKLVSQALTCLLSLLATQAVPLRRPQVPHAKQLTPVWLSGALQQMIAKVPDRGNTAQRISGLLLRSYLKELGSHFAVSGGEESVFATNTTSKKAGDIVVLDGPKQPWLVIEVTTKPFGPQRMSEAVQASETYAELVAEVPHETVVLCLPENVPHGARVQSAGLLIGDVVHEDHHFTFVDLYVWIESVIISLPSEARANWLANWEELMNDPNVREEVRRTWRSLVAAAQS